MISACWLEPQGKTYPDWPMSSAATLTTAPTRHKVIAPLVTTLVPKIEYPPEYSNSVELSLRPSEAFIVDRRVLDPHSAI